MQVYKSIKGYSGFSQLGIFLLFLGLGLVLTSIVQFIIALQMVPAGTSFNQIESALMDAMQDSKNIEKVRLLQIMGTLCMLFIPAILFSWRVNGKHPFWLGFNKHFNVFQIMLGFLIIFTANIMAGPLQDLSVKIVSHFPTLETMAKTMEENYNDQVKLLSHLSGIPDLIIAIITMAFFPALFEELFFRGALQNFLVRWWKKPFVSIFVSSLIFSLIHMSIYLFLSRLVLGFALGMMFYQTKNIWVNTFAHFLNNAIAVFQLYFLTTYSKEKIDLSKLDPKVDWWIGAIAFIVLFFLFNVLKKYSQTTLSKINTKESFLLSQHTNEENISE